MHDSQWLDHHGKRKNYLWLVVLIAAACVAAGIFIRNNGDVFKKNEPAVKATQEKAAVQAKAAPMPEPLPQKQAQTADKQLAQAPAKAGKTPLHAASADAVQSASSAAAADESVPLERITCRLMDKSQPSIRLSLKLSFPVNGALRQEILVKRDNLKIMVKKTLSAKSLNDMVADSLRKDLTSCLNSVLENGAITDIEFKEFRIEKVE